MKIKPFLIERFAKFIIGGAPFESMKRIAAAWDHVDMAGEKKRNAVLREFKQFGYELAGFLMNLGLELAVAWLKSQATDTNENR